MQEIGERNDSKYHQCDKQVIVFNHYLMNRISMEKKDRVTSHGRNRKQRNSLTQRAETTPERFAPSFLMTRLQFFGHPHPHTENK